MESIRIGGLYDGDTKHQAGSVWDKNKLAPTIDTMQGGYREPMIIEEIKKYGNKNGNYVPYDGAACYPLHTQDFIRTGFQDISYTLSARDYKDPKCVIVKGGTEMIDEVKKLGFMDNGTGKHQSNTVVDEKGLSPTITTINGGGTQQIKVLTEVEALNTMPDGTCRTIKSQYGNTSSANFMYSSTYGAMGAIETVRIKQATKDGYIECKVGGVADLSFPDSTTRRGRVQDGGDVCPTLMAGEQDICRIEKKCISTKGKENDVASTILSGYERSNMTGFNADNGVCEIQKVGQISSDGSEYGTVLSENGISANLVAGTHGYANNVIQTQYRIRKLTPRECYRLMAVPEESIDKMLEVNSNTQCYKQAGNSIVVNCLVAIFSQMGIQGIPRWNEGLSEKYK